MAVAAASFQRQSVSGGVVGDDIEPGHHAGGTPPDAGDGDTA
jgi:hypothetical protein